MRLTEMPKQAHIAHKPVVESDLEDEGEGENEDDNDNDNEDNITVTTHASDVGGDTDVEMEDLSEPMVRVEVLKNSMKTGPTRYAVSLAISGFPC
jgi:hypothetical protein